MLTTVMFWRKQEEPDLTAFHLVIAIFVLLVVGWVFWAVGGWGSGGRGRRRGWRGFIPCGKKCSSSSSSSSCSSSSSSSSCSSSSSDSDDCTPCKKPKTQPCAPKNSPCTPCAKPAPTCASAVDHDDVPFFDRVGSGATDPFEVKTQTTSTPFSGAGRQFDAEVQTSRQRKAPKVSSKTTPQVRESPKFKSKSKAARSSANASSGWSGFAQSIRAKFTGPATVQKQQRFASSATRSAAAAGSSRNGTTGGKAGCLPCGKRRS